MIHCSINYKIQKEAETFVSINERGFLFGDGVFETIRIHNNAVKNFKPHLKRLKEGLEAIKIKFDLSSLEKNIQDLIKVNNQKNGLARIYISRGIGSIGYLPEKNISPLIIIQTKDLPKKPKEPVMLCVSKYSKPSQKSLPINYKIAQGLNSTLAKLEADENNCFDAILLNDQGYICETSSANIFWQKSDITYTPSLKCGILAGTTREKVIAESKSNVKEVEAKINQLRAADKIFITNVTYGRLEAKLV